MNKKTELIGPHEGQEIALMLTGEKPLALFSGFADDTGNIPDPDFEPHVRDGTFVKREFQVDLPSEEGLPPFWHVLLARPEDTWRIDDAYAILNGDTGDPRRGHGRPSTAQRRCAYPHGPPARLFRGSGRRLRQTV